MPTLKELQDAVAVAQKDYDAALAMEGTRKLEAQTAWNSLGFCVSGKGNGTPLGNIQPFGTMQNISDCKNPSNIAACKPGGCCKKETCEVRVNDYNSRVGVWRTATSNSLSKKTILDADNAALSAFAKTDPTTIASIGSQKTKNTIIIILTVLALLTIIFLIFRRKMKK